MYCRLFYHMEDTGILNPLDEHHLFALHYIFMPRLSSSLAIFCERWNLVQIVEHAPLQLYAQGRITQLADTDDAAAICDADIDAPIAADSVHVPEVQIVYILSADTLEQLQQMHPLEDSNSFSMKMYWVSSLVHRYPVCLQFLFMLFKPVPGFKDLNPSGDVINTSAFSPWYL